MSDATDGRASSTPAGSGEHTPRIVARREPALRARVVRRVALRYVEGPDPALDRPAHVRAGSGLARVGHWLAVVQDDASFVALVDPEHEPVGGTVHAVALPAGAEGVRQFDVLRGNKADKLDLEACVALPDPWDTDDPGAIVLLAFGSGSTPRRERVAVVRGLAGGPAAAHATLVEAGPLYAALRAVRDFAGAQLNVEGAAHLRAATHDDPAAPLGGDRVRLLARGNGDDRDGVPARSASVDLDAAALLAWLDGRGPMPEPGPPTLWDLGTVGDDDERLGFTDATPWGPDALLYVAAAEASGDVVDDGPVAGSALGVLTLGERPTDDAAGDTPGDAVRARWTVLEGEDGAPFPGKAEGLARDARGRLWVVLDQDDPTLPAELCEIALDGPWGAHDA